MKKTYNKWSDRIRSITHYGPQGVIALLFITVLLLGTVQAVTPGKSTTQPLFTGIWIGNLSQTPGSYSESYPFSLILNENGTKVTGFSKIKGNGPYAVMSLSGKASGKNLFLTENRFIEDIPPEGTYWVLKNLTLNLNPTNSSILEGTWKDTRKDPLGFGTVNLSKCLDCRVKPGTFIILHLGDAKLTVNSSNVSKFRLYSKPGCKTCINIRDLLTKNKVPFEEINPDTVKGKDAVAIKNDFLMDNPNKNVPVIVIGNQRFVNVTDDDVKNLMETGFFPKTI